jgi:ElaB/YqjD/DUF883 family membrane-anchored ribosome-binding protein
MTDTIQDTRSDLEAIKEDIAALKRDVAAAMETMRENAAGTAAGIAQQISDEASALYREVSDRGAKATQALGAKVEEQPLTSVLMAFAIGYVVSRITR